MNSNIYEVIIIGGGPVGASLGIELGLQGIKTLILEKYENPKKTPRAQTLSARTMELFLRWGIDEVIERRLLLPADLPQNGVWCSTLNDKTYYSGILGDNNFLNNESPKHAIRIPLWITEDVLRQRIQDFSSVTFLKGCNVQDIELQNDLVRVISKSIKTEDVKSFRGKFLVCCDGAYGPSKMLFSNHFKPLSEQTKILSITFQSHEILQKKKVTDGIFYSILTKDISGFFSPIDLTNGIWLAQIVWMNDTKLPSENVLSQILDKMVGEYFEKKFIEYHFWNMQVQIAEFFSLENRVFWLGDSAHAFAPTGGLGLNTGFGDVYNIGWKLGYVIKGLEKPSLLASYEKERYPVWMNNLAFAKKNAEDFLKIKQLYPIKKDINAFGLANAKLGSQFLNSSKLTMGYRYGDVYQTPFTEEINVDFSYHPKADVGYFLPHINSDNDRSIYYQLSAINWNLIICRNHNLSEFMDKLIWKDSLNVIYVKSGVYPYKLLLIRPDWHIAQVI